MTMTMTATPFTRFADLRAQAARAGLRITDTVDAGRRIYRVFRLVGQRAVYLGRRSSLDGLAGFVARLARA